MKNEMKTGIRKIYIAQILKIIAIVFIAISAVFTPFINTNIEEATFKDLGLSIAISILIWPAILIGLYGLVMNIRGIYILYKEESIYKKAFMLAIAALMLDIVASVITLGTNTYAAAILKSISIIVYFSVIFVVVKINKIITNQKKETAKKRQIVMIAMMGLNVVFNFWAMCMPAKELGMVTMTSILASIFGFVVEILYLRHLKTVISS